MANVNNISALNGVRASAYNMAAKLANDKDEIGDDNAIIKSFEHVLEELITAREEVQRGPLVVMFSMEAKFGSEIENFPEPDSKQGETGNLPYDKGKIDVVVDGERKTKDANFYAEFFAATAIGKRIEGRIAELAEAVKANADMTKLKSKDIIDAVKNRDARWLTAEHKMFKVRKSNGTSYIKRAMKLRFAVARITENFPDTGVEPVMYTANGQEQLARTLYPFVMFHKTKRGTDTPLNVSQLIRLGDKETIAEAKQRGGTFEALAGMLRREGGTGAGQGKEGATLSVVTSDQFFDAMHAQMGYLDLDSEDYQEHVNMLKHKFTGKKRDQAIWDFGNYFHLLRNVYEESVKGPYQRMLDERAKAEADVTKVQEAG